MLQVKLSIVSASVMLRISEGGYSALFIQRGGCYSKLLITSLLLSNSSRAFRTHYLLSRGVGSRSDCITALNHFCTWEQYNKSNLCLLAHVYSQGKLPNVQWCQYLMQRNTLFIYSCHSAVIAHQNNYSDVNKISYYKVGSILASFLMGI